MYHNIPMELRAWPHWVVWRYEMVGGRKTKVPYSPTGQYKANVNNPATWGAFDVAVNTSTGPHFDGIGFVLTENDPYTGIDIDDKLENPASDAERKVHEDILRVFDSYTERSVGGRGYHIIIKGKIKGGRDRGHVGVYSTQRYLTFSGEVVRNTPIGEYQQLLEQLISHMPDEGRHAWELEEEEGHLTDQDLFDMALHAANGEKFNALTSTDDWKALGYTSWSEADLALLAILAYYSRDNDQIRRVFRCSPLGRREKATCNDRYINTTLELIRSKQPSKTDLAEAARSAQAMIENMRAEKQAAPEAPAPAAPVDTTPAATAPTKTTIPRPPGLIGDLTDYFFATAQRPIYEAALCAALGLMAGVNGRVFNISQTGLNQYLLLLAGTGRGKEGIGSSISRLLSHVRVQVPMADDYMGPGAFASGQALIRVLDKKPSFLSVMGEFGLTMQAMNDPRAQSGMQMMKRVMLDLYMKSGWSDVLRSTAYSDEDKNTKTVRAPAFSILGESTPSTFYDHIDARDIATGLIPRLQIVEYKGKRPRRNRNAGCAPSAALVDSFAAMLANAVKAQQAQTCGTVQMDPAAEAILDAYDEQCDALMDNAQNEGEEQLWSRAHLKALKLAGLVAVGCNWHAPCVTAEVAQWAVTFTHNSTAALLARFSMGDVGEGEAKQWADLVRIFKDYFEAPESLLKTYRVDLALRAAGVVPYSYLVMRAGRMASFYRDRFGAAGALKKALDLGVATERLSIVDPVTQRTKFAKAQALYVPSRSLY